MPVVQPTIDIRNELLLIGGTPRAGKTLLAQRLWKQANVVGFSIDVLVASFVHSAPESGVTWADTPDRTDRLITAARFVAMSGIGTFGRYFIEGDGVSPTFAAGLRQYFPVKTCFLVLSEPRIDEILEHEGEDPWVRDVAEADRPGLMDQLAQRSASIVNQCQAFGFPWIDMSAGPYMEQQTKAFNVIAPSTTTVDISSTS